MRDSVQSISMRNTSAMHNLITTAELAAKIMVHRSTLTRWVKAGKIVPHATLTNGVMLWTEAQAFELYMAHHGAA